MSEAIGRPTSYKKEYCKLLIEHMASGLSFECFAGVVKTCKQTIYNWTDEFPEFLDAKKQGAQASRLQWEKIGLRGAAGGPINAATWIFNMKNRFNYRDKVEHSGDVDKPLVLNYRLDESK